MRFIFAKQYKSMTMKEAAEELKRDGSVYLVDVRKPQAYAMGHIQGSVNVPVDRIDGFERIMGDKGRRIFVYCTSGVQSRRACGKLVKMGYGDVTNIGGIVDWKGALAR